MNRFHHVLLVSFCLFLTFFSVRVFPGYQVEQEDQVFYTSSLIHQMQPKLLGQDFLVQGGQTQFTLYDELILIFTKDQAQLFQVYFYFTLLTRFLLFLGVAWIGYGLTQNIGYSFGVPILFLVLHQGEVVNALFQPGWLFSFGLPVHARSLAISLTVLGFGLFFRKQHLWAWGVLSVATLTHSITTLPCLLLLGLFTFWTFVHRGKNIRYMGYYLLPLLSIGWLMLTKEEAGNFFWQTVDQAWLEALKARTDYLFAEQYFASWRYWVTTWIPLMLLLTYTQTTSFLAPEKKRFFLLLPLVFAGLMGLYGVGYLWGNWALILQFQFLRFVLWIIIFLMIGVPYLLIQDALKQKDLLALFFLGALYGFISGIEQLMLLFLFPLLAWNLPYQGRQRTIFAAIGLLSFSLPVLMFNTVDLWQEAPNPKAFFVFLANLALIALLLFLVSRHPNQLTQRKYAGSIFFLLVFFASLTSFIVPKATDPTLWQQCGEGYKQWRCELYQWADQHISSDQLSAFVPSFRGFQNPEGHFAPLAKTSFYYSLGSGQYLRSVLGKNIFVLHRDGAQGTFNRDYLLEWDRRMEIAEHPQKYTADLERYGLDYVISLKPLRDFSWPKVFENPLFVVYKRPDG